MKKDIVAGLGEIGFPIYQILSKVFPVDGYDIDSNLIPKTNKKLELGGSGLDDIIKVSKSIGLVLIIFSLILLKL